VSILIRTLLILKRYSPDYLAEAEELWRRIALTILITNVDDHMRNHGFLHVEKNQWRLSPAFDINPFPDKLNQWVMLPAFSH